MPIKGDRIFGDMHTGGQRNMVNASAEEVKRPHSSIRRPVYRLSCRHCTGLLSDVTMQATLVALSRITMYSAPVVTDNVLQLADEPHMTKLCGCLILDTACAGCGSVVGYHVREICSTCARADHNGHRYVFFLSDVHDHLRQDAVWTGWHLVYITMLGPGR